jgi:AcrR family transcriptional regulator
MFAERELREFGAVNFQLSRVLEAAGVSKSSAYHHFGSRDGIIAAVEMKTVTQQIEENNRIIRLFVENAPEDQSATEFLRLLVTTSGNSAGEVSRQRRAATLVAAQGIPVLAQFVGETQRDGAEKLAETLELAIERGWISPMTPALGIAHWILTSVFGRILVDLTDDDETKAAWEETTLAALIAVINPQS